MSAPGLSAAQRSFLNQCFGSWRVLADHSWGLTDTAVLEVESTGERFIVKAGGPGNHHISRELRAHQQWTKPWLDADAVGKLVAADQAENILVITYLPGELVEGSAAQDNADTYRQAGHLLATFHDQHRQTDATWNERLRRRVEEHLTRPHRISPVMVNRIQAECARWPRSSALVVPTHGDWHPRNWLVDDGTIRAIDLGRCDLRVPEEDFVRLGRQDFFRVPALERAFLDGYGRDPRDPGTWRRVNVAEAVGTAVWAHGIGDKEFEAVGHAHLARLYPG